MEAVMTGGSVVILGDGQQSRDFIYVSDVVDALIKAATARGVSRKVLNIGSGKETTISKLIAQIEAAVGQAAIRVRNREKSGGVRRLVADITQAHKSLDFRPRVSLEQGLRLMLSDDLRFKGALANLVARQ
jgi:UDP-glucose 4-epimerase